MTTTTNTRTVLLSCKTSTSKRPAGGEGYHLTKGGNIDTTVDLLDPEALVYAPGPDGQLPLAAVAYVVHKAQWDAEGHAEPPSLMGQRFHYFPLTDNHVLHAWVWRHNPTDMFEDWNPTITCLAS